MNRSRFQSQTLRSCVRQNADFCGSFPRSGERGYGFETTLRHICAILLVALATTPASSQELPQTQPNLKRLAREAYAEALPGKAREHLQALLNLYRQEFEANRDDGAYMWSRRLSEVAHEYLRGGQLADAMAVLGEGADLNLPFDEKADDGLGSAAAGWHRRLMALDPEERFELLHKWSMPRQTRHSVRVLNAITPTDAPPSVFARTLGERPRGDSFAAPEVGDVSGLFSSAWELVTAADDAGTLRRLTSELSQLADDDMPNAHLALTLAKIVGSRRPDDSLLDELKEHATTIQGQAGGSRFATLPLAQRVWQFGYGQYDIDAERTASFNGFPYWDGTRWRGGASYPDEVMGWINMKAAGGHPGLTDAAIRRWIAPTAGTLAVIGSLQRDGPSGNGVRGRLVSSRVGLVAEWVVQTGSVATRGSAIDVQRGDTIDFIVDAIDGDATMDSFSWTTRLDLTTKDRKQQTFDSQTGFHGPAKSNADLIIAAACLTQDWLQPIGESILKTNLEQTYGPESLRLRPFLRYAHATAIQKRHEDATELLADLDLALWLPSSTKRAWPSPQGGVRPVWLSHQDHLLHAFGPRNDYLLFKYPLTGDFEFSCETQVGGSGGTDGCVAYGGLGYEVWAARTLAKIFDASFQKLTEFHCPFVLANRIPTFNRFSLTSSADRVTFSANGHPIWADTSQDGTSPWIGLRSWGERAPIFRDLKIVGEPVIPREVKMSAGNSLRGWVADYYGESTPPPPGQAQVGVQAFFQQMLTSYDWSASGGTINGAKRPAANGVVSQSRMYYLRPLQDGESISYEFEYKPDEVEVHPTLGRIAFLLESDGVRLHWMTDGDLEWTGLAEDNAVVEPLNRRGPKPLPLKAGEWNRVTLDLKRDTLTLSLNNETIYTRKMEPEEERTFGFYHDKNRTAVRIRNVVMRGDWPERLTDEQLQGLAASSNPDRSKADRQLLGAIFDDQHVHGSVIAVHRRALKMAAKERYAFLSDWVLPGDDHSTLRMALDFTPTNPAPPASDANLVHLADASRVTNGGELVSPALDLVAVAKELGKLDALRERVAAVAVAEDSQQRRSQLTMLALVDIAAGKIAEARQSLDELAAIVIASNALTFSDRWPETLAIWEAARYDETRESVREMAFHINVNQIRKRKTSGHEAWDQQMRALASRVSYFDLLSREPTLSEDPANHVNGQSPLVNWVPTSRETARTRGQGYPQPHWALSAPATVENFASHHDDYLFYRIPLRGNFEVECDVTEFGYREMNLWVAGRWTGPVYTLSHVDIGDIRSEQRLPLDPPLHKVDAWIRYRAVVRDGVCTTYANGREIHRRVLDTECEPWLAIRSFDTTNGAVRNLRIIGNPEIPTEVRLTVNEDLPGWLPINEGHRVGRNLKWQQLGDLANGGGIRGKRWELPGSHWETLLRYHRPMVEDGTIEYDFYYREGETHVHPALDRLAFMLQPDGVRVHWVTDEQFDRTGLAPDNLFDEPDNRRGPEALPLKANGWNRLQLSLAGDVVKLELNDELIYERKLELTNQRTFGLFHYADRTEALVRNVVWRGDWPRELPPVAEQELAGEGTEFLDESLDDLAAVFHHDFVKDGRLEQRFGINVGKVSHFETKSDGLHVTRPGGAGYNDSAIVPHLTIHGDFDITAAFEQFEPAPSEGGSSGVFLQAILDSEKSNECLIYRRHIWHRAEPQPIVQASYVGREVGGARRDRFTPAVVEAPGGRLRLARRGDTVYFLFAENNSPLFRLFATETAPLDDVRLLKLMTQTHLEGMTKVVWKSLTIRATELSGLALQNRGEVMAKMDKERDSLASHFVHDFAKDPLSEDRFQVWGPFQPPSKSGVRMISIGRDRWTSSGFNSLLGMQGDFDVSLTFDELKLAKPKEALNSAFYLQIEFPDAEKTQVNVILVEHLEGEQQIYAQIRFVDAGGNNIYRRLRIDEVNDVEKLRLVRRGKHVSFLYRTKGSDRDRILAEQDVLEMPVPQYSLRLLLHTGGDGRQSQVLLKQLQVHAEKIDPNPSGPPASLQLLGKQLTDEPPAHALEFDGRTQYVTIPSIRYDGSHPITLEAFVTPDNLGGVVLGDTQQSGIGLQVRQQKYNIHTWNGTGYDTAGLDIPPPRFLRVHLAGTFDGKTLQMFVNGRLIDTRQVTGRFTGSALPMTIGASPSRNERGIDVAFDGLIDQVRISKTVRYQADFAVPAVFDVDAATLALFRFDEGQGETLTDSSGNNIQGQLRGARWVTGDAIRLRAAQGLAEFGRHGVPILAKALADEDADVQLHSIAALGRIGQDAAAAIPALRQLAKNDDKRIRDAATQALKLIEAKGVIRSILDLFGR